jgi:hypothetical protein
MAAAEAVAVVFMDRAARTIIEPEVDRSAPEILDPWVMSIHMAPFSMTVFARRRVTLLVPVIAAPVIPVMPAIASPGGPFCSGVSGAQHGRQRNQHTYRG